MNGKSIQKRRHLAKSLTWRVIAAITTFLIGWAITGDVEFGAGIAFIDSFIKFMLYYFHERLWYRCSWGIIRKDE